MADKSGISDLGNLYRTLREKMLYQVSRIHSNPQEVEDVVQEAFVKVIEAQQKRDVRHPESYLQTTARNIAYNKVKAKSFRLTETMGGTFPETDLLISASFEEQFEERENFEIFCRAVRSLPLKCRRVYVLSRVYGYTNKEVARILELSLKGVEGHLARATVRCIRFARNTKSDKYSPPIKQAGVQR